MKKKRIALILFINIMALVLMTMVMVAAAWAADSPSSMGTESAVSKEVAQAGSGISVTLLNVSIFPPYTDYDSGIAVYYDHNEGIQTPYYGGSWVGIDICNNEDVPQTVTARLLDETGLEQFPPYSTTLVNQNAFMLGKGQEFEIEVPDIPADGACQIAYFYVFTPRFKTDDVGGCEIWASSSVRGECGTQKLYVEVVPTAGVTQTVSGTLVMDEVKTANPGEIVKVQESSEQLFTLTVSFESGNLCTASGTCAGTYAPTTYYDYDASVMHLISISAVATDTNGSVYTPANRMRLEAPGGIELNQDPVEFVFLFERDKSSSVTFNPSYAANSGNDNYKGDADMEGIPTAITLQSVSAGDGSDTLILALAGAGIIAMVSAMIILRRRQRADAI